MLGFDDIRRSVTERRMEVVGVVVGEPAVEASKKAAGLVHSCSHTSSSFRVRKKRSVSALPLGLL